MFRPWIDCVISTSLEVAGEAADNALPGGMRQEGERRGDALARDPGLFNICRENQDSGQDDCIDLESRTSWLDNKTNAE